MELKNSAFFPLWGLDSIVILLSGPIHPVREIQDKVSAQVILFQGRNIPFVRNQPFAEPYLGLD